MIVAIPVMLAGIRKDRKYGFLEGGFFTIAILCCLTPWLIRNPRITAVLFLITDGHKPVKWQPVL
jgi:hypothetical protein